MAANKMLTLHVRLDAQPGGVVPELHLKTGIRSAEVKLYVDSEGMLDAMNKRVVIRGVLPDGTELFLNEFTGSEDHLLMISIDGSMVSQMAAVPGTYKCSATILDTSLTVTRKNYMNYEFLTVLPFTVIVHDKA